MKSSGFVLAVCTDCNMATADNTETPSPSILTHDKCCVVCNGKSGHVDHPFSPPSQLMQDSDQDDDVIITKEPVPKTPVKRTLQRRKFKTIVVEFDGLVDNIRTRLSTSQVENGHLYKYRNGNNWTRKLCLKIPWAFWIHKQTP